jgi:hypothetical protein
LATASGGGPADAVASAATRRVEQCQEIKRWELRQLNKNVRPYSVFHPDGFAANRGFNHPSKSINQIARTNPEASTGTGTPR